MADFDMAAALTMDVVESTSIATEGARLLLIPKDGCNSKCVAQTRQSSRVVDQIGIVFAEQRETFAIRLLSLRYGFPATMFLL